MASHRPLKGLAAERSSSDHTRPFTRRVWWRSPRGLYYGWVLAVALGLTTIISYGTTQYLFGVLVIPLGSTFGWGRAGISAAYSLGLIISGLLGVPIGRLVDRRGARLLMTLGSALAGIALIGLAWIHTLWQFYALWSGVLGLATALTLYPVSFTVVTNWFERRRGKALAVLTLLGGLASPIFVPFAGWLVLHLGWRGTVIVLGLMQLCIALPIHGLVLRRHPEDLGFSPDGKRSLTVRPEMPLSGSTLQEALRRPAFWMPTASLSLVMMGSTVVLVHQVPSLIDRGYDAVLAATLAGMLGLASLPGRYVFNIISERVSPQRLLGISVAFQVVGVIVLIQATSVGWLVPRIAQRDEGNLESCPGSGSVCRAGHGAPVTWQKRRNLERKEQQMRGTEGKPGKKAMRHHSERWACPRREHPEAAKASLRRRQTEESGEDFWDARSA